MSVQAMKHSSVSGSLAMWSPREGLCSETPTRLGLWPKENAQTALQRRAVFCRTETGRRTMENLQSIAKAFAKLLDIEYRMIIGRKGKTTENTLRFDASHFHHLAGFHKLITLLARDRYAAPRRIDSSLLNLSASVRRQPKIFFGCGSKRHNLPQLNIENY